jgi:hypothetical protein
VVCCWMVAGGCLVFVGLGLFDSFSLLVVDGSYVCSQHRLWWISHDGGDRSYLGLHMICYGFDGSLAVLVCGASWRFSWWC